MREFLLHLIDEAESKVGYELSEKERSFLRRSVEDSLNRRIYKYIRGAKEHKTELPDIPLEYLISFAQEEVDDLQHFLDAIKDAYNK